MWKLPVLIVAFVAMSGYFAPSEANGQGYFSQGKQSFRTKQHPKAKGLDLQIDFPSGWLMEEGKRPNVVVIATSAAGKGLESCTIVIRDMEQDAKQAGYRLSKAEVTYLTSTAGLQEEAQASALKFIGGGPTTIEGLPAGWMIAMGPERAGLGVTFYSFVLRTFYEKWQIILNCGVGDKNSAAAWTKYQRNDPGFRLIANSIVIHSKWSK